MVWAGTVSPVQPQPDLGEDGRVSDRRPADHHGIAAGLDEHARGIVG